jgi:adenylate cyclase class 2
MHTEFEVRVLEIDADKIIKKLDELHATFLWDKIQRRYVYDLIPKVENKWIRLRTNGDKTTLTIKNVATSNIDGTQELEIVVDDFDRTNLLLKELGYEARSYQENRRIQYDLNGVEIDIDTWPKMPTYMEVEGSSEEAVYNALSALDINKEDCTSLDVESLYYQYGIDIKNIKELKFEEE